MPRGRKPKQTDTEAPKPGHNGFDPKTVTSFVARVENRHAELDKMKSEYMLECKGVRGELKDIYQEAKDAGIPKRALKSVVHVRALERKVEAVREDLETEDQESHDQIRLALGDLADLPLGKHALGDDQPFASAPQ